MKKELLIGMLFIMFAFVMGANPLTEVDIGAKIECEALEVDQLATVDNVLTMTVNENLTILNEEEVETSHGDMFAWQGEIETMGDYYYRISKMYNRYTCHIDNYNIITENSEPIPLLCYRQKDNVFENDKNDYRYLKIAGTERVINKLT